MTCFVVLERKNISSGGGVIGKPLWGNYTDYFPIKAQRACSWPVLCAVRVRDLYLIAATVHTESLPVLAYPTMTVFLTL